MARSEESRDGDLSLELVKRIQGGDSSAWERVYTRYHDPLLLAIRCRLSRPLRARLSSEDILHSVVREAMGDLAAFEPRGKGSLSRYLFVCVVNKIRAKAAYFGARKRAGTTPLSDSLLERLGRPSEDEPGYVESERYERLERALAHLPEAMREAVLLRRVEGLSNQDAAEVLKRTPESTSKLYNRGLARLGSLMAAP